MIQTIIEFAKLVPGFSELPQDDQIMLLKGGAFEIALIRGSQLYSNEHDTIIVDDMALPVRLIVSGMWFSCMTYFQKAVNGCHFGAFPKSDQF